MTLHNPCYYMLESDWSRRHSNMAHKNVPVVTVPIFSPPVYSSTVVSVIKSTMAIEFPFSCLGHLDCWNLQSLKPSHSVDCQGGPIWCIAENPASPGHVAVGSEDGMVRNTLFFLFYSCHESFILYSTHYVQLLVAAVGKSL